jgi:hypothetical protein
VNIHLRRALSGASLALFAAVATAGPIVLDTEQKAAAGVATALLKAETPREVNGVIDNARDYAHFTLRTVRAATTPAALLSTPGGMTINCSISGTLTAKMADELPRVLRVRWNDCVTRLGFERRFNGPVAITLPADTFQPQSVLAIRFGNASGEFLNQWRFANAGQNDDITEAFKLVMSGDVSLTRLFDCCEWVGTSAFRMNGYFEQRRLLEAPLGTPPQASSYKVTAQGLQVVRSTNSANGVDEDDTRYAAGSVSTDQVQPPPHGAFGDAYTFRGFRVARTTDFVAFTDELTVDGRIDVTWNRFRPTPCVNGWYAFRTAAPLIIDLGTQAITTGRLGVNGSVIAKFYSAANVPPSLPSPVNGMLLSMRVRDVGTFNYDVAFPLEALGPAGQCF